MSRASRLVIVPILLLLAQTSWGKGITVRIEIEGEALSQVLTITDPSVVEAFNIWSGPSSGWVQEDGSVQPDYSGAFIDFERGPLGKAPRDLLGFEVRFFVADRRGAEPWDDPYRVRYAVDPAEPGGYMYLPMPDTSYIWHGVEDDWFRSAPKWEERVRPLIDVAMSAAAARR